MSSKIPAVIAFVCCLSVAAVRAQTSVGHVGPVEDVPVATSAAGSVESKKPAEKSEPKSAPKKDDESSRPEANDAKKDEDKTKTDPKSDPKAEPTVAPKSDAKNDPKSDPKSEPKVEPKSDPKSEPTPAPITTAAANTNEKPQANSTTDAPPKANETTAPVREASPVGLIPPPPKYEPPKPLNTTENTSPTTAANVAPVALSPTSIYRVGTGDVLDIRLVNGTGHDSTLYTILTGGMLDYPLAGDPLGVAGLTTDEIAARLSAELKHRGLYDHAQFHVAVRDYSSHTVMVSGLVDQPGQKVLRREAVPLYVVLADALPRADAGRAVIISRTTGASKTVDLGDQNALNELVSAGDVVNVQARPPEFYYIGGQIGTPGQKDFHAGLTLTQAILASGGLTRDAGNKVKVTVSRQGADGRLIATDYLLKDIESGQIPDPRLQPGDRIEVGRRR
jgi:protein involved in polysaccharide export with SLBB domain